MSKCHLFSYPYFHLRQANRLALPRKQFRNVQTKPVLIYAMVMGILTYYLFDITRHFIVPLTHFQRDRFTLNQTKSSFQTLVLSHQPLSARQKLQEKSLF